MLFSGEEFGSVAYRFTNLLQIGIKTLVYAVFQLISIT